MIQLRDIVLRRGGKTVLDRASMTIHPGERVGLVGRNGAGKSSLFRLLDGTLHEDAGDWSMPAGWQVAQVAQEMPETDETATAFVLGGDTRLAALQRELEEAQRALDVAADDESLALEVGRLHGALADAGAHDATARAQTLILGLGFAPDALERPVRSFSGGWRMRLQLARALMCPSDLLLLDEPTNHLDLDALVWLESWLQRYGGTLIVISHDRAFLDAVTSVTVHLSQGKLTRYGGNYSAFEELRAQQLRLAQGAYEKQQARIAHLQKFIDRFKAKATKAKQAQSRVKALERMERVAPVLSEAEFEFEFRDPPSLPNPMIVLEDVECGYPREGQAPLPIVRRIRRSLLPGQRIGVLGANGQGKSTFIKTLAGALEPLSGQLRLGKGLRIGYFAQQELDVLRPEETPLQHMVRLSALNAPPGAPSAREQELRNFLGSFHFSGDMVAQPVGSMSGGEKARLVLAMLVWQRPNLLLLDEPTNHLDLATREALAMALNTFEGSVLLVSHDRALLDSVCDDYWLVADGELRPFDGDLEDYQRFLLEQARRRRAAARIEAEANRAPSSNPNAPERIATDDRFTLASDQNSSKTLSNPPPQQRQQRRESAQARLALAERLRPLRRQLEACERRMAELEAEKTSLEQSLMAPAAVEVLVAAGKRLKIVQQELEALEEQWLELSETIERISMSQPQPQM
jgi:ATP-binding cassette subfamily F protein 3